MANTNIYNVDINLTYELVLLNNVCLILFFIIFISFHRMSQPKHNWATPNSNDDSDCFPLDRGIKAVDSICLCV